MSLFNFKNVKLEALSVIVPENEINIYDEAQYYDNSVKKIDRMRKMVGFYKRRVADKEITPSDLGLQAAQNLIREINLDVSTIDALLFVVQQPDYVNPASAYFIHKELNLSQNCIAMDINQGCVGWIYGLIIASQLLQNKQINRILLINADTPSVGVDINNRNTAPLFGDAGCATLLEYSEQEINSHYNIETFSNGFEDIIEPFSGTRFRLNYADDDDFNFISKYRNEIIQTKEGHAARLFGGYLNGINVFDFTINKVPENIKGLMKHTHLTPDDIEFLCLHQANKQIVQAIAAKTGFENEKAPYQAFERYGNNTMCSIPTTISMLRDCKKEKILCCGFGNGLVCASALLNMQNTNICEIKNFIKPQYIKSRDEYVNYWIKKIKGE